ncbi:hypothetical protein CSC26_6142 [Pseudomonas aeruginosa]|nr:hypothetical protein CSC26_6142 [Pseudomonas aeruginosa]
MAGQFCCVNVTFPSGPTHLKTVAAWEEQATIAKARTGKIRFMG